MPAAAMPRAMLRSSVTLSLVPPPCASWSAAFSCPGGGVPCQVAAWSPPDRMTASSALVWALSGGQVATISRALALALASGGWAGAGSAIVLTAGECEAGETAALHLGQRGLAPLQPGDVLVKALRVARPAALHKFPGTVGGKTPIMGSVRGHAGTLPAPGCNPGRTGTAEPLGRLTRRVNRGTYSNPAVRGCAVVPMRRAAGHPDRPRTSDRRQGTAHRAARRHRPHHGRRTASRRGSPGTP